MPAPKHQPIKKKLLFAAEYLKDQNGTQAALRAGYAPGSAGITASKLLKDPIVAAYLREHTAARVEKLGIDVDRVLTEVSHGAFFDPADLFKADGTLKPLHEMPEAARRAIAGIEVEEIYDGTGKDRKWIGYLKKIKLVSKEGMLTLAARHLGMLKDNLVVTDGDRAAKMARFRDKLRGDK